MVSSMVGCRFLGHLIRYQFVIETLSHFFTTSTKPGLEKSPVEIMVQFEVATKCYYGYGEIACLYETHLGFMRYYNVGVGGPLYM